MAKILLVDDENNILNVLKMVLSASRHDVTAFDNGEEVIEILKKEKFDLMLSDIRMNPVNGIELLRYVSKNKIPMPVIMLTAYSSIETASESLQLGAFDYILKPFKVDELMASVKGALKYKEHMDEASSVQFLKANYHLDHLIAESEPMKGVCDMIQKISPTNATVLICGEAGTGKSIVARTIHACSNRKNNAFLEVNCATLPEPLLETEIFGQHKNAFTGDLSDQDGLIHQAAGGTLFLNELNFMPMSAQEKLLTFLKERRVERTGSENNGESVDTRILVATNMSPKSMSAESFLNKELFNRISVIPIEIPPLRNRKDDIMPLAYNAIKKSLPEGRELPDITPEACSLLRSYSWPGNVRELENIMQQTLELTTGNSITKEVLPSKLAVITEHSTPKDTSDSDMNLYMKGKSLKAFLNSKLEK